MIEHLNHYFSMVNGIMEAHPWIALIVVGVLNDLVQRFPKIRANSLLQILPNLLKLTPLGRMPGAKQIIEALDTPTPPAPKAPAMFPPEKPSETPPGP